MITDEQIRKISLVIAVIGIIGIAAFGQSAKPEKLAAANMTEETLGRVVEISGTIASYSTNDDGHVFITLADGTGKAKIVMFERTARTQKGVYDLRKGDNVIVKGKAALYRSELEIQADSIERTELPG